MKLETRFNLIIASCLLIGLTISGTLFYQFQTKQAEDTLLHDASLIMEYAKAVRTYTIEEIRPALEHHNSEEFLPQIVPSYAAHTTIAKFRDLYPEYTYREVALNPTNSADRGNAWEVGIVQAFRNESVTNQLTGEHKERDSLYYFLARPIRITDVACLACHDDPSFAPATMKEIYGSHNGFGWKLNEIIGARIVTVPANIVFQMANNNLVVMLASLACIFLLTHAVFGYVFRRYVTRPLEVIAAETEKASLNKATNRTRDSIKTVGQIGVLDTSIRRLRRSLAEAISMIEKNKQA